MTDYKCVNIDIFIHEVIGGETEQVNRFTCIDRTKIEAFKAEFEELLEKYRYVLGR